MWMAWVFLKLDEAFELPTEHVWRFKLWHLTAFADLNKRGLGDGALDALGFGEGVHGVGCAPKQ